MLEEPVPHPVLFRGGLGLGNVLDVREIGLGLHRTLQGGPLFLSSRAHLRGGTKAQKGFVHTQQLRAPRNILECGARFTLNSLLALFLLVFAAESVQVFPLPRLMVSVLESHNRFLLILREFG